MNRKEFLQHTFRGFVAALTIPYFSKLIHAKTTGAPSAAAPEEKPKSLARPQLLAAAREIMAGQTYCALVTQDANGRPQIRTMNPFPPEDDMTVWIATSTQTRKAQHMRTNPNVTLYYANHAQATGYVAITGHADLIDDRAEMIKRKRAYWDEAFPGFKNLVLIKVTPERLDVVNYKAGALNDPLTWRSPTVDFKKAW